ncbi:ABC transporter ATP-binding protein [Chromobacterium sp. ATCC 53434]|uniref:ABC transporter ATP-binding protein n=1 Tax=Chromobacterium TaxID=535 RepID=UPI000C78B92F|nr:ABC transporter ATP-binding protein [Chromobacterium sp. ATCC 53434]AUH50845.1 ABC transporter ATP-binding protein [Chromobacterium sp. ATCC 53434]
MLDFLNACRRVVSASGHDVSRIRTGMAMRALERICAVAPYFLAWRWLSDPAGVTWWSAALWLVPILIAQMACSYLGQLQCFLGSYAMTLDYRRRLIDHLRRLPLGAFGRRRLGEWVAALTDDVKRVEDAFTHLAAELLAALVAPALCAAALCWVDWRLGTLLVTALPLGMLALAASDRFFRASGARKQALFAESSGLVVEYVGGLATLKLFNQTEAWLSGLDDRFDRLRRQSMGAEAWGGGSIQAYRLALEAGLLLLIAAAADLLQGGELTAPVWLLFVLLAYKMLDPLLDAAAFWVELKLMVQSEARLQAMLDEPEQAEGAPDAEPVGCRLAFEHVAFGYGEADVLRDLSFVAEQGQVTAIVGTSGSGKSTALNLLARFYDPRRGRVTLGGRDLRELSFDRLYGCLGFVFQDVQLFDGSILDNVRIGRPDADDEEVMEACRQACCEPFVKRLPDGYASRIGENGQQLSGGERQRLSIARAMLKNAPVLLLDEATASVDPQSQHMVQQALARLMAGRTVVVVAHRLQTVRHADRIVVLENGAVSETGRHEELMDAGGLYAELWRRQHRALEAAEEV